MPKKFCQFVKICSFTKKLIKPGKSTFFCKNTFYNAILALSFTGIVVVAASVVAASVVIAVSAKQAWAVTSGFSQSSSRNFKKPGENSEAGIMLQDRLGQVLGLNSQESDIIGLFATELEGESFVSVSANGEISLWNLKGDKETTVYSAGLETAATDFYQKTNILALAQDTEVILFDIKARQRLVTSPALGTKSSSLAFAPDGKSLLIGGEDGKVYRWILSENESGINMERYLGHSSSVTALRYHPFNRFFFSADSFGNLAAWQTYDTDLFAGKYDKQKIKTSFYAEDGKRSLVSVSENSTVLHLKVSADGQNLFVGLQDGRVEWRLVRGLKLMVIGKLHSGAIYDLQVSPDGSRLAGVARDGKLKIWKMATVDKNAWGTLDKKQISESNDINKDSQGYFTLVREIELPNARKLIFLDNQRLIVGELGGRLLEVKL